MSLLEVSCKPHFHQFRKPFKIAHGARTGTDVVFLKLKWNDFIGFGEASLPPYLPDNVESTLNFFKQEYFQNLQLPYNLFGFSSEINQKFIGNYPAKAALNMALWDLKSKMEQKSISSLLLIETPVLCPRTFTLGIGSKYDMQENIDYALSCGFALFKIKLNGKRDEEIIKEFKSMSDLPFAIDANQSWTNIDHAKKFSQQLQDSGCILIEQPFSKSDRILSAELKSVLQIPVIADEACQTIEDISGLAESFDGINIKLQKCGGIAAAFEMINMARSQNLLVLMGCMSESTVACNAAEALSPLADWADLDGPWLIKVNPTPLDIFK